MRKFVVLGLRALAYLPLVAAGLLAVVASCFKFASDWFVTSYVATEEVADFIEERGWKPSPS